MKTSNVKSFFPLLLMIIAITSAFAFKNEGVKTVAAPEIGWVDHPAPCTAPEQCENEGGPNCTIMFENVEYDVKGKFSPNDLTCEKVLTRSL
jgi:hypothetical protein